MIQYPRLYGIITGCLLCSCTHLLPLSAEDDATLNQKLIIRAQQRQQVITFNDFNIFYKRFWNSIEKKWINEYSQYLQEEQTYSNAPLLQYALLQKTVNRLKVNYPHQSKQELLREAKRLLHPNLLAQKAFEIRKRYYDNHPCSFVAAVTYQLESLETEWIKQQFRTQLYLWLTSLRWHK